MGAPFSGTCGIQCRQCSPLFRHLRNSVPERASYGTEYACRAKKGVLRYATRFQKPSVRKTGFWGTEAIFGTGNALLRYATRFQRRKTADSADCGQPPAAPNAFWDETGATAFQTAGLSPVHKREIGYIGSEESEEPTNNQEGRPKRSASARRRANKIRGRPLSLSRLCAPLIYPVRPYPSAPPHLKYGLNY